MTVKSAEMRNYYSPLKKDYSDKYDDTPRSEIVDLIESAPDRVLEIGCGPGATGALIKQKFSMVHYTGLELDGKAAQIAMSRLDRVITADIEHLDFESSGIEKGSLDLIICADVLEHLYDPWKILHVLRDYLVDDGKIIASIPNTQYIDLVLQLLRGSWNYSGYGLLDATHIRFFTINEINKLFSGTRYKIVTCVNTLKNDFEVDGWPRDLDFGDILLRDVSYEKAISLFTFQYLIVAQKNNT